MLWRAKIKSSRRDNQRPPTRPPSLALCRGDPMCLCNSSLAYRDTVFERKNNSLPVGISALYANLSLPGNQGGPLFGAVAGFLQDRNHCVVEAIQKAWLIRVTLFSAELHGWKRWLEHLEEEIRVKVLSSTDRHRGSEEFVTVGDTVPCGIRRLWPSDPMSFLVLLWWKFPFTESLYVPDTCGLAVWCALAFYWIVSSSKCMLKS